MSLPTTRIPLTVIGGFLGAGKTTLLNRMLRESQGRRLAVLVNDFGALNIDAGLLASSSGDTIALTNGCVCCTIGDDLSAALIRVLDSVPPFEGVVIEASGVSDPWRIAQIGLADPQLQLDGVVVMVDAGALLEQASDPLLGDSLLRQLKEADLIVLNKTDLVADEEHRRRVREWVHEAAPRSPMHETVQAEVPSQMLWGVALHEPRTCGHAEHAHGDGCDHHEHEAAHGEHGHHDHSLQFETWACRPSQVFEARAIRQALRDMPAGVLRLKGFVRTDDHGWAEVQFAGRHGSLRPALAEPESGPALVAIGLHGRLPAAQLDALFAQAKP